MAAADDLTEKFLGHAAVRVTDLEGEATGVTVGVDDLGAPFGVDAAAPPGDTEDDTTHPGATRAEGRDVHVRSVVVQVRQ